MSQINITSRTTLSDKKYKLEQVRFEKTNHKGKTEEHLREIYHRPHAVSVLLVDHKQRSVLLTKQFRLPVFLNENDGYLLEACAGVIDEGETATETAQREAIEETGYEIKNLTEVARVYTSPASIGEYVYLFIGEIDIENKAHKGGGLEEEGEEIEPCILSFEDAFQKLNKGEIHDMKTVALLGHFFRNNPADCK